MPDPSLSDALREAYASAPADQVIWHTLELWHAAFSVPIRVVCDVTALDARIEDGAARDAGAIVTFAAYPFTVVPPDVTAEALPQVTIEIDNVTREILTQVDTAIAAGGAIEVIYRQFLSDTALIGPETDPPLTMELIQVSSTRSRIRATAGFATLQDAKFPGLDYDLETFPGLAP